MQKTRQAFSALAVLVAVISGPAHSAEISHSWAEAKFTPCEGVGVHGSFRVWVGGTVVDAANGAKSVTSLSVHTSSGAYTASQGSTAAVAIVRTAGAEKQRVTLSPPSGAALVPAPKPDETARIYLPAKATLTIPKGSELFVRADAAVKTGAGMCSLGGSEQKVPL